MDRISDLYIYEIKYTISFIFVVQGLVKIPESSFIYLWTDSTVILARIKSTSYLWQSFVGHRIAEIQSLLPFVNWNFIEGVHNPADIAFLKNVLILILVIALNIERLFMLSFY